MVFGVSVGGWLKLAVGTVAIAWMGYFAPVRRGSVLLPKANIRARLLAWILTDFNRAATLGDDRVHPFQGGDRRCDLSRLESSV